jgi:hypothetical protein
LSENKDTPNKSMDASGSSVPLIKVVRFAAASSQSFDGYLIIEIANAVLRDKEQAKHPYFRGQPVLSCPVKYQSQNTMLLRSAFSHHAPSNKSLQVSAKQLVS